MKSVIFGSTGKVGQQLVNQALELGYSVTAFTRNADKIKVENKLLYIFEGDVLDYQSVKDAIMGKDLVLCTLGAGRRGELRSEGTSNIIKAMEELNVSRLICQTTLGCGESWNNLNFLWKRIMFGWFLKQVYIDHESQEKHVFNSNLDWTIVRPSAFTYGKLTKEFHTDFASENKSLKLKISTADIAYFMLQQSKSSKHVRKAVGISY